MRQTFLLTPEETTIREHLRKTKLLITKARITEKNLRTENNRLKQQLATSENQNKVSKIDFRNTFTSQLQYAEKDKNILQTRLSEAKKTNQELSIINESAQAKLATLKTKEAEHREAQVLAEKKLNELLRQRDAIKADLDGQVSEVANLKTELSNLRKVVPEKIQESKLKQPDVRQAYAAGVSLGQEMLQMHAERQKWGANVDKKILLAGLFDTFYGHIKLDNESLNQALTDSERQVTLGRNKILAVQLKQDSVYLASFKKNKQVKPTPAGAWYRIDYSGDEPIPDGATLDVVIKESLTDGTVIQDMDTNGAVLSQPMAKFPPLFSDAMKELKNHGSLTLVVPPELAYGEKGYPPNVPPNATMVYNLRIAEIY